MPLFFIAIFVYNQVEYDRRAGICTRDIYYLDNDDREELSHVYKDKEPVKKDRGSKLEIYDWIQCIVVALVFGILIFMHCFRIVNVDGLSMYPTLYHTDKIITSNLFYSPEAGDIVVVQTDTYGPEPLVKRIIATGGQTIDIDFDEGIVYVDGVALDEPYINSPTMEQEDFEGPLTIPDGYLFLMGDNRNRSTDSRSDMVGLVDERCVIGKVYFILVPGADESGHRDWSRIGSMY